MDVKYPSCGQKLAAANAEVFSVAYPPEPWLVRENHFGRSLEKTLSMHSNVWSHYGSGRAVLSRVGALLARGRYQLAGECHVPEGTHGLIVGAFARV